MADDVQPWHCNEQEWLAKHAPINSAGCYALGISELRCRYLAGEPIPSAEYGPREIAAEAALLGPR